MSFNLDTGILPEGFSKGPFQGLGIIGEITEAIQRFILEGWDQDRPPPRIEEDLSFVPKDRQEVIYVYMYRVAHNTALKNTKRWRPAKITFNRGPDRDDMVFERAPLYLDVHYAIAVHSKFRSDAERLLGWVLLRLWEANRLIYRPRRYTLPSGQVVESTGAPWDNNADGDKVIVEQVRLALVDDLPIGDAINFFTIHDAPFRPYITYRACCSMEGALVCGPASGIVTNRLADASARPNRSTRPGGRMVQPDKVSPSEREAAFGPRGFDYRPDWADDDSNSNNED